MSETAPSNPSLPAWPVSTYRLQFHAGFTFSDARKIVPYLNALGITHIYASPILKARPGSTHGYDVVDHHQLNPELGSRAEFDAWSDSLAALGMQLIVDIVPNHMGVACNDNAWWNDCLENGPEGRHGGFFDITWRDQARPHLRDKVLLPVLGDLYGTILEQGKLKLVFDENAFFIAYYDRRFPVCSRGYTFILKNGIQRLDGYNRRDVAWLAEMNAVLQVGETGALKSVVAKLARDDLFRAFIADTLAIFNGIAGQPNSFDRLHELLELQFYRLAFWRTAPDQINYRRFFDINDLAALRMERADVFEQSHEFLFELIAEKRIAGLRIDHPDGLWDPAEYFRRIQGQFRRDATPLSEGDPQPSRVGVPAQRDLARGKRWASTPTLQVADAAPGLYVVVEKILAADEALPREWAVHGTTGYDYMNKINALFIDSANEPAMTRHYNAWTGSAQPFNELAQEKKRLVVQTAFAGDLDALARRLKKLADRDRHSRDFTLNAIRAALCDVIAAFPVYRTYLPANEIPDEDSAIIKSAICAATETRGNADLAIFHFIENVLLLKIGANADEETLAAQREFAGRFQQLTAPVTAKGIEDTAFYIYNRLVSLNEVGGDPGRFGEAPSTIHEWLKERQKSWPLGLSALSTHDTKRSEDVRARLNVLSEMPEEWWRRAAVWSRLNEPHRKLVDGRPAPDPNDEILLYQALVGAWPLASEGDGSSPEFIERIQEYMRKAMREAKVHSSWTDPNGEYESAVADFIAVILSAEESPNFVKDFRDFQRQVSHCGLLNSLSQTVVRLMSPGVPDTYQGTELWDFSLVDPDNRRAVDYAKCEQLLAELQGATPRHDVAWLGRLRPSQNTPSPQPSLQSTRERELESSQAEVGSLELSRELIAAKEDGRVKLFLTWLCLTFRRDHPELFAAGEYFSLKVAGVRQNHIFAFGRFERDKVVLVIVPRLMTKLAAEGELPLGKQTWGDTSVILPESFRKQRFQNLFTGEMVSANETGIDHGELLLADILQDFPVAVLYSMNAI